MDNEFVTVRLTRADAQYLDSLRAKTGLSKTEIVRKAIRQLAGDASGEGTGIGLFDLGAKRFGMYGDAKRQSSRIGQIARARASAKRTRR